MSVQIVASFLAELYNTCIQTGIYITKLKVGQIVLIFKGGAKDMCNNYRSISLLSPFTKILENCLYKCLHSYFENFKYFHQINLNLNIILRYHMLPEYYIME